IGRTSIAKVSPSFASPQFGSCSENYAIQHDVFGQTLRDEDVYREGTSISVIPIPGVARNDRTDVFPLGPVRQEPQQSETGLQAKCNRSGVTKSLQGPLRVGYN